MELGLQTSERSGWGQEESFELAALLTRRKRMELIRGSAILLLVSGEIYT